MDCGPVENITLMDWSRPDTRHTQSNQSMSASPGFFDKCNFFVAELRKSAKALSKLPL